MITGDMTFLLRHMNFHFRDSFEADQWNKRVKADKPSVAREKIIHHYSSIDGGGLGLCRTGNSEADFSIWIFFFFLSLFFFFFLKPL